MATTVAFSNLNSWLQAQPENTVDTPYEITITGLTTSNYNDIKNILTANSTKYVDLSTTSIPSGVTNMFATFVSCTSLVKAPTIPNGVTNMMGTFAECYSLTTAPVIPSSVTDLNSAFLGTAITEAPVIPNGVIDLSATFNAIQTLTTPPVIPNGVQYMVSTFGGCHNLTTAPVIPNSVTNMERTFELCDKLTTAPIIPDSVTNMDKTFDGCVELSYKSIIPSTVTTSTDCYRNVVTTKWQGTKPQAELCPDDCEYRLYNSDRVTLEDTIHNVDISTASSYVSQLAPNTSETAYKFYIRGLTPSNANSIRNAFGYVNGQTLTKFYDFGYTTIPQGTTLDYLFGNASAYYMQSCRSMVTAPVLPNDQTTMTRTFQYCDSLKNVTIPNGITSLERTFISCSSLETIIIPSTVTTMVGTFTSCVSLVNAPEIPSGVTNISEAFAGCTNLEYLPNIPNGVTDITETFYGCAKVRKVGKELRTGSAIAIYHGINYEYGENYEHASPATAGSLNTYFADTLEDSITGNDYQNEYPQSEGYEIGTPVIASNPITNAQVYLVQNVTTNKYYLLQSIYYYGNMAEFIDIDYIYISQNGQIIQDTEEGGLENWNFQFGGGFYEDSTKVEDISSTFDGYNHNPPIFEPNDTFYFVPNSGGGNVAPEGTYKCIFNDVILQATTGLDVSQTKPLVIPATVTKADFAFYDCTSLTKIDEFKIPLNTLKNNTNFQDMFKNCNSLTQIGYKIDSDQWHAFRLKFGASSVEGKIFDKYGVGVSIPSTSITKDTVSMPVLTDELWFPPSNMSDADIETLINKVISNRYTYWKKSVVDPTHKSFVLWADDENYVVTNVAGGGIEKEVVSTTKSETITKDRRIFANGSGITITLSHGSTENCLVEVFAIQACTITYYTAQGTTVSLSMAANTSAVFIYFSGWKYCGIYGAMWN